ncbi:MAG TPA: DinB family protein [Puia sp.]
MAKQALGSEKYAHYSTELLLKAYIDGPKRVRKCIKDLTKGDLRAKPIPGKWSIAEIVIHLADGEIIGACRFRQAYTNHTGPFPFYNEAVWAEEMCYQEQSAAIIESNLRLFSLLRQTTANLFAGFEDSDWSKTGIHPERGEMTLRGLLELYADHSERHIEQILERRKLLGKQLPVKIILRDRLY